MDGGHAVNNAVLPGDMAAVVRQYWGFEQLRPLQAQAIEAGIDKRDSLVVLPTGGGKSLCYQVPPIVADRTDIVISPLISLMKDQVDGLLQNGYPAAALHSNLTPQERQAIREGMRRNQYRLLFVTPERLLTERFLDFLDRRGIRTFAIDEAHCISQWGHDFRQEYRKLAMLKQRFPDASLHAYTATATERVRQDIIDQLGLVQPQVIVGQFDRPNLVYRIVPAMDVHQQILQAVRRHHDEAVIIYCISRKDTEAMAAYLQYNDIPARAYHAGLDKSERSETQEAFASEKLNVVVATVAFGMGIDRSNVRCVIHAAMPKTVEHYQQETGRAGRDGLEAECVLFYSNADLMRWEGLIKLSAEKAAQPRQVIDAQMQLLTRMQNLCGTLECRHRALSRYFGQDYDKPNCGACDVCLEEVQGIKDATTIAQKILSCVYRLDQRFGVGHVVQVLRGSNAAAIRRWEHDQLSTYGILRDMPEKTLTQLVYQLLDQGLLERGSVTDQQGKQYPTVQLGVGAKQVLRGERQVHLIQPDTGPVHQSVAAQQAWEGVDQALFDALRELRRQVADEREVPAYVIFSDAVLRELARVRPTTLQNMGRITGIGQRKLEDLGQFFADHIREHARAMNLETDQWHNATPRKPTTRKPSPTRAMAMDMFARGASVEEVMQATGRATSTVWGYLEQYIEEQHPESIEPWAPQPVYDRVIEAARKHDDGKLKSIFEALNEEVPYGQLRIILTHYRLMR